MGFDKPDLGFVVHLGAPPSPIAYYQQVGRAGRAPERGERRGGPAAGPRGQGDLGLLRLARLPAGATGPGHPRSPGRGGQAAVDQRARDRSSTCPGAGWNACSRCSTWTARCAGSAAAGPPPASRGPTTPSATQRIAAERAREQQAMLDYLATDGVPDGVPAPPARRPRRRALRALRQLHRPAGRGRVPRASSAAARERLLRPGVTVEPRRMWPTGMTALGVDAAGKIPADADRRAGPGPRPAHRPRLGRRLRALLAEDAPDEPVTEPVVAAAIKVLAAWDWAQRPAGVADPAVPHPAPADHQPRPAARRGRPAALPGRARLRRRRVPARGGTTAPSG